MEVVSGIVSHVDRQERDRSTSRIISPPKVQFGLDRPVIFDPDAYLLPRVQIRFLPLPEIENGDEVVVAAEADIRFLSLGRGGVP